VTQKNSSSSFRREPGLFAVRCCFCFCATEINDDHPTSENGKLAAFASGRPVFQQYAEHAEGSNTPLPRTFRKYCAQSEKNSNITKLQKDHAAQRGRDASEQRRA